MTLAVVSRLDVGHETDRATSAAVCLAFQTVSYRSIMSDLLSRVSDLGLLVSTCGYIEAF